jgi:hypothetical protein
VHVINTSQFFLEFQLKILYSIYVRQIGCARFHTQFVSLNMIKIGVNLMKNKFFSSIVISLTMLFVLFVPVQASNLETYPERIVATINNGIRGGGTRAILESIQVTISICNGGPKCRDAKVLSFEVIPSDSGKTLIATPENNADFTDFVALITDGVDGFVWIRVGGGGIGRPESSFFGTQTGPNGIDLEGSNINLIGLFVNYATLDIPGSDPKGDGLWSDYELESSLMFLEPILTKEECKDYEWQELFSYDGSVFKNQGDCIQYFLTGF